MKMTKRIISTIVLSAALFTSSAFACGTMTNGSKGCLVESPTTGKTTITRTETKSPFDFDKDILSLFRNFFGKIFG